MRELHFSHSIQSQETRHEDEVYSTCAKAEPTHLCSSTLVFLRVLCYNAVTATRHWIRENDLPTL